RRPAARARRPPRPTARDRSRSPRRADTGSIAFARLRIRPCDASIVDSGSGVRIRARGGDEVAVRRRADAQAPPNGCDLPLELRRLPGSLDDVELAAVREPAPGDLARRGHEVAGVAQLRVVHEEHPAVRLQRAADQPPERLEAPARHMRVPEPDEAGVELTRRLPLEDIGEDVLGRVAGPRAVQLEHLGDGVDGGHALRVPEEVSRPDPGPGGELEDVAARPELLERRLELPHVGEPAGGGLGIEDVAAAAKPPVVVLGRPLAVVPPLLGEQQVDRGRIHADDSSFERPAAVRTGNHGEKRYPFLHPQFTRHEGLAASPLSSSIIALAYANGYGNGGNGMHVSGVRGSGRSAAATEHAVVIAGAGPTGLMLAGELALAGVDAVVVERRTSQDLDGSRSGGLHSRTIEVLDQRGIAERFLSAGQVMQVQGFSLIPLDIGDFPTRHNYGLALWQSHFERILAGWVAELGVPILRGREVLGFAQDDAGVEVAVSGDVSLRAEYLVGCDGGRSLIRKVAGIDFPGLEPSTSWLIAEVELDEEPEFGVRRDSAGQHAIGRRQEGEPIRLVLTERSVDHFRRPRHGRAPRGARGRVRNGLRASQGE